MDQVNQHVNENPIWHFQPINVRVTFTAKLQPMVWNGWRATGKIKIASEVKRMTQEMRKSDAEQIKRDEKISYWNEVSSYRTLIYGELEWYIYV